MENFELIYDLETGEQIVREYTKEENAKLEKERKESDAALTAKKQSDEAKAAEKAALLEKLGITEDEAKLLLS
jgi:hypothetical protein